MCPQEAYWRHAIHRSNSSAWGTASTSAASSEHGGIILSSKASDDIDSGESFSRDTSVYDPSAESIHPTYLESSAAHGETVNVSQPTLHSHGPQRSVGSEMHEQGRCIPCSFYCFKKQGCGSGAACNFCHMAHTSNKKLRQREWRKAQDTQSWTRHVSKNITGDFGGRARSAVKVLSMTEASGQGGPCAPPFEGNECVVPRQQPLSSLLREHPNEPCFITVSASGCSLSIQSIHAD